MEKNNSLALPIAIVLAGVLVAGAMFYTNGKDAGTKPTVATSQNNSIVGDIKLAPPNDKDSIVGKLDADVVVVEYSDTECPYCKVFHQTMQQIVGNYATGTDNKVAWIYRYMPLDALHKKARKEAVAVECAKQQAGNTGFWAFIDEVFAQTNSNDSLDPAALPKIAKDAKLDVAKWTACYNSNATADVIKAQEQTGTDAGVQGTPNNFLVFKKPLSKTAISNLETAFSKYPAGLVTVSPDGTIVNLAGAMPYNLISFVIDNGLNTK